MAAGRMPAKPALRQRFEGSFEGSWIESQSRRWRQEPYSQSTPGAARKGQPMYIGIGTVVLIVIIVLVILMLRRRLCCADAPASSIRRMSKEHMMAGSHERSSAGRIWHSCLDADIFSPGW
jgi:hypothetical protein